MKQADDDEDFSTETEKMMKEAPGLKGAMLYARRRIIEKATAREMARSVASSTTLPPFQFVNEKGEDTVGAFIAKQADDDEDFSSGTEKMMKVVPGLKGAMLYARRRRIENATARELARNAAISTTLPPFQFVNERHSGRVHR